MLRLKSNSKPEPRSIFISIGVLLVSFIWCNRDTITSIARLAAEEPSGWGPTDVRDLMVSSQDQI
jgi:hypothetical protein